MRGVATVVVLAALPACGDHTSPNRVPWRAVVALAEDVVVSESPADVPLSISVERTGTYRATARVDLGVRSGFVVVTGHAEMLVDGAVHAGPPSSGWVAGPLIVALDAEYLGHMDAGAVVQLRAVFEGTPLDPALFGPWVIAGGDDATQITVEGE